MLVVVVGIVIIVVVGGASFTEAFLVAVAVEVWEAEVEEAAAFLSLRSVAAEACIADCTSGRMWSSTLLKGES